MVITTAGADPAPGEACRLRVRIRAPKYSMLKGVVRLEPPAGFPTPSRQAVQLAPDAEGQYDFVTILPSVSAAWTVGARFVSRTPGVTDMRADCRLKARFRADIVHPAEPLLVDGNLKEWGAVARFPMRLEPPQQLKPVTDGDASNPVWQGADDLSALAAAALDTSNLYFAIRVRDNNLIFSENDPASAGVPVINDSVELFLDLRPPERQGTALYERAVLHLLIVPAATADRPTVFALQPDGGGTRDTTATVRMRRRTDGYDLELSLRRADWPALRGEGNAVIGCDLAVNDRDDPAAASWKTRLIWASESEDGRDPSLFGKLRLKPQ